jgi:uncharacterized protein (TIRG00374 family)
MAATSAPSPLSRRGTLVLSVGISAAILVFLGLSLDWQALRAELHRVRLAYLPLLAFLLLVLVLIRALRWRLLLPGGRALSLRSLFESIVVGFMASFVLPLRAGEIVRPWILSRWQPVSFPAALASIVTERLFDAMTLVVMLGICLLRFEHAPPIVVAGARVLGFTFLVLLVGLLLCYVRPGFIRGLASGTFRLLLRGRARALQPRAEKLVEEILAGLRAVGSVRDFALVVAWSAALWLGMAGWYQAVLWTFGDYPSFWTGFLINVMVAVAVAVPSAPGFIGTFQAGCLLALVTMSGYSKEFAGAYSIVAHAVQIVLVIGAGLAVLSYRGLSWRQLRDPCATRPTPS